MVLGVFLFLFFGYSWWFFEVLGNFMHFLVVFGGSWLFFVGQMGNLWFFVIFSGSLLAYIDLALLLLVILSGS